MPSNMFSRRDFMRGVGAGALAGSAVVRSASALAAPGSLFQHGVASGDPLTDRVIIWTRVTPTRPGTVAVLWEVALDAAFSRIIRRGRVLTGADIDYTVKADVLGLPANARLHYRFRADGQLSPAGRTRTLPAGAVDQIKLAVLSCSNFPAGYFNVYAEVAKLNDLHAAVHLGDYIYEYSRSGYASQDAAALGRVSEPADEIITLDDYRIRHAQYRTDVDLQAMHAALPVIAVWDDHEITNDTWREGAENHTEGVEGVFAERRAAAIRAYHEWMPTRLPDPARPDRIYRSFRFGNLLSLHMLDTRVIGRDEQMDYANYLGASGFDTARFTADLTDPNRSLLGVDQMNWLGLQLAQSDTTWDMLGQQVLMGRMNIPAPLVLGQVSFTQYSALLFKAQTAPATLTPQEQFVLAQPAIPYNLDAWDGYAVARETLLGTARALDKNLVVLAGDTHNAWASDLTDFAGNRVGVEFATSSVTSPGFEEYFPAENPLAVAAGLTQIIGPLQYADTARRGFMLVTATAQSCRAEWRYVSTVKSRTYTVANGPALRMLPGAANRKLVPG
ncbi:phoD-like phosphatase family protein [Methyloversatilis sp. RAC08]|uniref:alkaline phosphatase D family protein n=1 Tax=Methyloversatilis sp. RAC08 TaxID=1842540 RepID=UPI00083DA106|nr:alkaline phosphatase D family protein [Methyloversatilis sp. RAC08]AOF81516.1 phoD-like phosphatase family protein [Methyloversatilis sp. RAC08]